MEKETLNLIIGGGIGFLASFLVTIATFIFQNHQNNKKRKWDLEDQHSQSHKEVISRRLNQIEQDRKSVV